MFAAKLQHCTEQNKLHRAKFLTQTTKNPLRASKAHRGKSIIKIMKQPDGLHHAAHAAAHAGSASGHSGLGLFLLGDDTLGRQEHAGDAGSVLQSDA